MIHTSKKTPWFVLLLFVFLSPFASTGQQNRQETAAGSFYPEDAEGLKITLNNLFEGTEAKPGKDVRAIVCPHAGYVYSGKVAANSFSQLPRDAEYDQVFLLGPSHRHPIEGASIYKAGNYITPLGEVQVNTKLANKLVSRHDVFSFTPEAHKQEHSLEVQLPFIQHYFNKEQRIVPILINTRDTEKVKKLAKILQPYMNADNLFVVSTDFSHYPPYKQARRVDSATAGAIATGKPGELIRTVKQNARKDITNLSTSMCGFSAVLTLMYMAKDAGYTIRPLMYRNSGDARPAGKNRVVGYWSMRVTEQESKTGKFGLTPADKEDLLHLARETLTSYIETGNVPEVDPDDYSSRLQQKTGCFVTLNKNQKLRGCMGNFYADQPLCKLVQDMTLSAALHDPRFSGLQRDELDDITLKISVLTPLRRIHSIDAFEPGKHGIYIKKGERSGTYLPQVAQQVDWDKKEFIRQCAQRKAGIPGDGWKNASLYVYEAIVFSGQALP